MIVRPARPEDAARIAAIWNHVIDTSAATFTTEHKREADLAQQIVARGGGFQVGEIDGRVAGFATCFQFRGGPGYRYTLEHSIQLAGEARGRGLGRALMGALEDHARGSGAHSLWACVTGENPDGVAFHARLGYRHVARLPEVGHKFGRWMDLVLMVKRL